MWWGIIHKFLVYNRLLWSKNNTFKLWLIDHSHWSEFEFCHCLFTIQISIPRNKDLHLTLRVSRLRFSQLLSILLFNSANRFNRMFFPALSVYFSYFLNVHWGPPFEYIQHFIALFLNLLPLLQSLVPGACKQGSKSKAGAIKCSKENKITAPPNAWHNISLSLFQTRRRSS